MRLQGRWQTRLRRPLALITQLSRAIVGLAATAWRRVSNRGQALGERRQGRLDRLPHDCEVDVEVTVGHSIAHASHAVPRRILMQRDERRMVVGWFGRGLTEGNDIQSHRLLGSPLAKEPSSSSPSTQEQASCMARGMCSR